MAKISNINLLMARKCIGPKDLAQLSGVTENTIQRAKAGKKIRLSTIGKIAKALNVDPSEILKED